MPTFAGATGSIHYERWLPAGAAHRIVVVVHGYAEYGARYAHVADVLVADGAAVYAEDHMGHGHSDGERALVTDFELVVHDLSTLVDIARAEHPGRPVVVVGHSMGGLLSARLVQRDPEAFAGIVFLGAVIGDWPWAREVLARPELPPADTEFSGMSRDAEAVAAYTDDPLVYHGPYKRPLLEAEVVALERFQAESDRLTLPVLFCHGTADPYVDHRVSQAAVEAMPSTDKTFRVYEGARHELVNEINRDEVIAEIAAFVQRVT